ncbi:DUF3343 domain-containing protein [Desulfuromonas acetoxidans]|nr:DUF3343 domain-containing protein [Desulfuromonas acetoxidans]NVD23360.1 DUF3343 domain-containing protein [Desulfuromonas acetoxidans]NVE15399.1 DUF3343 domain-containing protein [Desulfuromonas acetoxidans]
MVEEHHRLIIFNSIHRVMLAEIRLQEKFDILLIPVPRALSSDCGMVIRFDCKDQEGIVLLLTQLGLKPFTIYAPQHEDDAFVEVGEFS